jgi:hypothetical protein
MASAPPVNAASLKDHFPRWLKDAANISTRSYGIATAGSRPVPDFLVIGTKRGGTTSLFNYLMMHPGVLGLFPRPRGRKSTDYFFQDWDRGERWYRSHFHTRTYRERLRRRLGYSPVGGEASPYYVWDPRIAQRVHAQAPGVRAIMLVRDPVERAWSHYQERVENGVEPLTFEQALAAEESRTDGELDEMLRDPAYYSTAFDWYSYRARGLYLPQLENWCSVFPQEQLLTVRSEDMYTDVQAVFDTVCTFLGIEQLELPSKRTFNASVRSSTVPADARAELRDFYAPHNQALENYLGRQLHWS